MVYKESALTTEWMPRVRFANGANVNLVTLRDAIQDQCGANGIPVAFREEELKVGGLFSKERESILIMYNPEHQNDYLKFAIRVTHQGNYAFMSVYNLGGSKNYLAANRADGGSVLQKFSNMVGGINAKLQAEENYYAILRDCLANVTGV